MVRRTFFIPFAFIAAGLLFARAAPPQAIPPGGAPPRADVERFRARADALLADVQAGRGFDGILVADRVTGEVLYERNPDREFIPASNAKLFVSALALATLGPNYRFHTTLESGGALARTGDTWILSGDLVLVGRGDPDLSNRKIPYQEKDGREGPPEKVMAELADTVVARGVKVIEGDVVADDSYFPEDRYPPGWAIDDMAWDYGAAVSALAVNDNALDLELRPGEHVGQPAILSVEPWAGFYTFVNEVQTGPPRSELRLELDRDPGGREIRLLGQIPLLDAPMKREVAIDQPAEYAAELLKRLLVERGVRVYGVARARHSPAVAEHPPAILAEHVSPPLVETLRVLNKASQNLHAEMILRTVGKVETGLGTTDAGLKYEMEFLKSIGVSDGDVFLADASGLSRIDLVTPRAVVTLLRWAAGQPWGEDFISTLPVAGQDGTLADRLKDTAAAGRVTAKTGSIEHVRAISGYATSQAGEKLVFSFFSNNNSLRGRDATTTLDALVVAMVEEFGRAQGAGPK